MKILRVSSVLYPYIIGGICVHVHEMSNDQVDLGHDVTVYTCLPPEYNKNKKLVSDKYNIVNFGNHLELLGNTICMNLLPTLITNSKNFDIIHTHGFNFFSSLICAVSKIFTRSKLVLTIHGLPSKDGVGQQGAALFTKFYTNTFGRFVFAQSDAIITYTPYEKDILISYGVSPDKIHLIHNGIHLEKFAVVNPPQKKKQILWIGRYVQGKGYIYLLEGFAQFSEKYPDYSLVLIGRGPEISVAREFISSKSLSNKVQMIDFIPNDRLSDYYHESEFFVLPSLNEGVPRTILESMACGVPVIATALPQLKSIVDGCGILIHTKDSNAISVALEKMASDETFRKKCSEQCILNAQKNYDWKDTVKKTNEVFENLIKNK